jgi:hypothetical protein
MSTGPTVWFDHYQNISWTDRNTVWKIYGTCITHNCKLSYGNYSIAYGTRYISLWTSKKYARTSEL